MRLFAATLATETNTFSPLPTSLDSYRECDCRRGAQPGQIAVRPLAGADEAAAAAPAAFGPIAKRVIYVDADGPLKRDPARTAFRKVQRPIWPLDSETSPALIF